MFPPSFFFIFCFVRLAKEPNYIIQTHAKMPNLRLDAIYIWFDANYGSNLIIDCIFARVILFLCTIFVFYSRSSIVIFHVSIFFLDIYLSVYLLVSIESVRAYNAMWTTLIYFRCVCKTVARQMFVFAQLNWYNKIKLKEMRNK